jgi:hypothetical protein
MEPGAEDESNESNGGGIRSAGKWLTFTVESPDEPGSILSADTEISVAPDEAGVDAPEVSVQ